MQNVKPKSMEQKRKKLFGCISSTLPSTISKYISFYCKKANTHQQRFFFYFFIYIYSIKKGLSCCAPYILDLLWSFGNLYSSVFFHFTVNEAIVYAKLNTTRDAVLCCMYSIIAKLSVAECMYLRLAFF